MAVSYRCLELYLFHLVKLWNVFYSGKIVYQAHPWKWVGFTSNPDFVKLHQDVVSWVPGVVFLSLCHHVCPRHELRVVSILLCYWLKKKINLASSSKMLKILRRRKFATWQGMFLQSFFQVCFHLTGLKDVCPPDPGASFTERRKTGL